MTSEPQMQQADADTRRPREGASRPARWHGFIAAFCFACGTRMFAQPAASPDQEPLKLTRLSLTELANMDITSVSRKEQPLSEAASAVYVITNEDIRRAGATTIAEALRMAPGLNVARINANKWAITSRGFNGRFANKLLVLMDGRTVYTPVFSGVSWGSQDTFMSDIDRIEVIRGPGATLWGANAVNGVINVITKSSSETQGLVVQGGGGTEETGFGGVRYGGPLGKNAHYRVYGKYFNRDDFADVTGGEGADEWWVARGGFRVDWAPADADVVTFQGDYYNGEFGDRLTLAAPAAPFFQPVVETADAMGANVLGRWTRAFSEESELAIQLYYDRTERNGVYLDAALDTFDFDGQHRFALGDRNEVVWGLGYRLVSDQIDGSYTASYAPSARDNQLFSGFIQDEISLMPDTLRWTLGTKLEHNDFTGLEVQPGTRLLWTPSPVHSVWASIARAARTPSRFEEGSTARVPLPATPGVVAVVSGSPEFDTEWLIAYELGYKLQPHERWNIDIATFYNSYDQLRTSERGSPVFRPGVPVEIPITYGNQLEGETYGVELAGTATVTASWRLSAGYSFLKMNLDVKPSSTDTGAPNASGDSPQHQFHARSFFDLSDRIHLDTALYYVDNLANQQVPAYLRWDVRIAWEPVAGIELEIVGQNLLDDRHREFGSTTPLVTAAEIERAVFGRLTWRF